MVAKIGAERCIVHCYASEFNFNFNRWGTDILSEWSPIEKLRILKKKFPAATTSASTRWLPHDLLASSKHEKIIKHIQRTLKENNVDTVRLEVPNETFSDRSLQYFLNENIIPHVGIDDIDTARLNSVYIGETDHLDSASTLLES